MSSHPEGGGGGKRRAAYPTETSEPAFYLARWMTPMNVLSATTAVKPEPSALDAAW